MLAAAWLSNWILDIHFGIVRMPYPHHRPVGADQCAHRHANPTLQLSSITLAPWRSVSRHRQKLEQGVIPAERPRGRP